MAPHLFLLGDLHRRHSLPRTPAGGRRAQPELSRRDLRPARNTYRAHYDSETAPSAHDFPARGKHDRAIKMSVCTSSPRRNACTPTSRNPSVRRTHAPVGCVPRHPTRSSASFAGTPASSRTASAHSRLLARSTLDEDRSARSRWVRLPRSPAARAPRAGERIPQPSERLQR